MEKLNIRFDNLDNELVDEYYNQLLDRKYNELMKMNSTSAIRYSLFGFIEYLKNNNNMTVHSY